MVATTLADLAPDQWLFGLYRGDATLTALVAGRVYQDMVPQDNAGSPQSALFPCIVIRPYVLRDTGTVNSCIFMVTNEYIVTAIARSAFIRDVEPIAARIHELTHLAPPASVSRGQIYSATRQRLHRQAYTEAGVDFRELGGIYRVYSQAS
jgi:hypothetical protein